MSETQNHNSYGKPVEMTVIGAGSYGTSLAISLARNGANIVLWGHDAEHMARLDADRANHEFLPGIAFPDTLIVETDLQKAVQASRDLLVVVPSHVFGIVLKSLQPHLRADSRICWATKGLEPETGRLLQDVAHDVLGDSYPLRCFLVLLLPKSWRWGCQPRFQWLRRMRNLYVTCKRKFTAAKLSECTPTVTLSVCSLAAR